MQTLTRRGVGDAAAGLGLHFLHMSQGPFSHEDGHIYMALIILLILSEDDVFNKAVHEIVRKISGIDVMIVKKCRPRPDAASETRRLVWIYTFCICPKVPFRMTLANYSLIYHNGKT